MNDNTNQYEFQNYTSIQFTKHFVKFGVRLRGETDGNNSTDGFNGTYVFPSLDAYIATLQGTPSANQYTVTANPSNTTLAANPFVHVSQVDVGLYVEDDWRVRPNITLSYGLRFESQNNINNHADWAPRLGFAWGIGGGGTAAPKTVLRAGFGIFYDRFQSFVRPAAGPAKRAEFGGVRCSEPGLFQSESFGSSASYAHSRRRCSRSISRTRICTRRT